MIKIQKDIFIADKKKSLLELFLLSILMQIISFAGVSDLFAQQTDSSQLNNSIAKQTILKVESIPTTAPVYLDSVQIGNTPQFISIIKGTQHRILVHKFGFQPFVCEIGPAPEDTLVVRAILRKYSGTVSIFTDNNESTIRINGKKFGYGQIDSVALNSGAHDVSVYDPVFGREVSSSIKIEQLKHISLKAEYNVVSIPRLFRNIILPGYAQFDAKQYLKGMGFTLAGVSSIAYMIFEFNKYSSAEREYKSALHKYDLATTEIEAQQARNIADRDHKEYRTMKTRFGISIGITALIWIGNALDVSFNHLLKDRIKVIAGSNSAYFQQVRFSEYSLTFSVRI